MKIFIIGAGLSEQCYLTNYAKDTIKSADLVVTTKRIYDKLSVLNKNTVCKDISQIVPFVLQNTYDSVCILVSGDIGFYSMAKTLREKLKGFDIEMISGISSLQYLTAKMLIPYDDIKVISVHGRSNNVIPFVCYNKKVFVLTGGTYKANDVIHSLIEAGLENVIVTVGENLSDENERIITDKAKNLKEYVFDNLAVVIIQNDEFVDCHSKIYDDEFIRGKSPMTKEAVRTLSISYLDIKPSDIVYDIGAGTGAVTIEMARKACESTVYAIEKQPYAIDVIKQNIDFFKAYNIKLIQAVAPDEIDNLPPADKVFIGGSSGNLKPLIKAIVDKNEQVKIVVNAITLETVQEAIACFEEQQFSTNIVCVNIANAEKIGRYNMMKAENPIYIISGAKKDDNC